MKATRSSLGELPPALAIAAMMFTMLASPTSVASSLRTWDLQDSVALRYISIAPEVPTLRTSGSVEVERDTEPIVVSPNGEYFFFANNWGELETDSDVTSLSVYRAGAVLEWLGRGAKGLLAPYRSIVLRSRGPQGVLFDPAWNPESTAILYQAASDTGAMNSFRLDVASGAVERLTQGVAKSEQVQWLVASGSGVLYSQQVIEPPPPTPYPAEWAERALDGSFLQAETSGFRRSMTTLYCSFQGRPAQPLAMDGKGMSDRSVWLSPDGSQAISLAAQFGPPPALPLAHIDLRNARGRQLGVEGSLVGYFGTSSRPPFPSAYWSADGRRVILVSVVSTRGARTGPSEQQAPLGVTGESAPSIMEYEIASGRLRTLERLAEGSGSTVRYVTEVGWVEPGARLLIKHVSGDSSADGTLYTFNAEGVQSQAVSASMRLPASGATLGGGLRVRVAQSASQPPRVMVSNGGREVALTGVDPALRNIQFQRPEVFSWREQGGNLVSGVLTLPRGLPQRRPVPLVIHVYVHRPNLFLPDGPNRTAEATQVLVARGIATLQVAVTLDSTAPPEGVAFVERIDTAVEALTKRQIVDPRRVGLTGFSRGGYETFYAVTHPGRVHLAAAMGEDFFGGSYIDYLDTIFRAPRSAVSANYERYMSGSFWERKEEWLKYETTFNADRVITPLLVTRHEFENDNGVQVRRDSPIVLARLGSFIRNDKPVEYLYMGHSAHELSRPLERLAETEALVDWMSFWLQGYEDPSPHKAKMYERWRPMREQQAKSIEKARALDKLSLR